LVPQVSDSPCFRKSKIAPIKFTRDSSSADTIKGEPVNPCNPPENPRITRTTNPSGWVPGLDDVGRNEYRIFNHKRHRSHKSKSNLNGIRFVNFEIFVVNRKNPSTTHRKALDQPIPIGHGRSYIHATQTTR
jgi:hypothetical protein